MGRGQEPPTFAWLWWAGNPEFRRQRGSMPSCPAAPWEKVPGTISLLTRGR
jgi:hypothetical protein